MDVDFLIRLAISFGCGAAVGIERQLRNKPAGVRTSILVCMAVAVFTHLGYASSAGDPTRVLGQVVTGIGFLGGGVIFRHESSVTGITSAATIFALAAIGASIGVGRYLESLVLTFAVIFVLAGVTSVEQWVARRAGREHHDPDAG